MLGCEETCYLLPGIDHVLAQCSAFCFWRNNWTPYTESSPALDISAGPGHFSDRRTSSGQYILSFTGPYGPPRYMSGHQISNSAGPNDDKSQYVLFVRAPVPHLGSFRAFLLLQRDASVSRVGVGHVNQTH